MENKIIVITQCSECPFCDPLDMAPGYRCTLGVKLNNGMFKEAHYIKEDKKWQPITPDWCPLIKTNVLITQEKQ